MGKLTDLEIKGFIKSGERFEQKGDGDGLYLRFRSADSVPCWLFRYRLAGKQRIMHLGSYKILSLAEARRTAKELRARVALGFDPATEKQDRKRAVAAQSSPSPTVGALADDFYGTMIFGRWKSPHIVKARIENDIKPHIGRLRLDEVLPTHVANMLKSVLAQRTNSSTGTCLQYTKRMFDFAIKRGLMTSNPAAAFDSSDAGGKNPPRERWLTRQELASLFDAMRRAKGWNYENTQTVKLLLMTAVRKTELIAARVEEFDLDAGIWHLPKVRTKTGASLDIPLPHQAVHCIRELVRLGNNSAWLLPARKPEGRMIPHISTNTVGEALGKYIIPLMECPHFVVHDFRRTARTHIEALGFPPHIGERCLNHKLDGIVGIYNRHDYIDERKEALQKWADLLELCERGGAAVIELKPAKAG